MDISNEYILMCEKSVEIQLMRKPFQRFCNIETNDIFYHESTVKPFYYISRNIPPETKKTVWLPRQDQLQEMIISTFSSLDQLIDHFYIWCNHRIEIPKYMSTIYQEAASFEVLWLMYVMRVNHTKQWNKQSLEWELVK